MRQIKFRALHNGRRIYSDDVSFLFRGNRIYIFDSEGNRHDIDPKTVEEFLGIDKNGDAVYENDVLEYDEEKYGWHYEYLAHMKGFATTADGCYVPAARFKERTLKKCAN